MIEKKALLQANRIALKYFCSSLDKSEKAKKYLFNRLSRNTIKKFYLGYAPKRGLVNFLKKKHIKVEIAVEAGLLNIDKKDPDYVYEPFTNRIIFPVFNNGHVVGFGGRTLINHDIKYINSRATLLYNKGELLYLLDYAKKHINTLGNAILVEGYMDVLSLIEKEIRNVVGTCGTACRKDHAMLLRRWTDEVYTCFDGDTPGKIAQERAEKILRSFNIYGGDICLPENYDPDDFVREFGKEKFLKLRKI